MRQQNAALVSEDAWTDCWSVAKSHRDCQAISKHVNNAYVTDTSPLRATKSPLGLIERVCGGTWNPKGTEGDREQKNAMAARDYFPPHLLFYSSLYDTGASVGVQQKLMRHARVSTTINAYGNALMDAKREANTKVVRKCTEERIAMKRTLHTHQEPPVFLRALLWWVILGWLVG